MFDLDFFRRLQYYVRLLQAENKPIKYLTYHQSYTKKKNCIRTIDILEDESQQENQELKEYLGIKYMPYFDMAINPLSNKQFFVQHKAKQNQLKKTVDGQAMLIW